MTSRLVRVRCQSCAAEHEVWVWSEEGDTEAQVMVPCDCQHDSPEPDRETREQALAMVQTW